MSASRLARGHRVSGNPVAGVGEEVATDTASGEIHALSPAQWKLTVSAKELYRRVFSIIRDDHSTFHGAVGPRWRYQQAWRAVLRTTKRYDRALLVAHTFGKNFPKSAEIPMGVASWQNEESWPSNAGLNAALNGTALRLGFTEEFRATVVRLHRS